MSARSTPITVIRNATKDRSAFLIAIEKGIAAAVPDEDLKGAILVALNKKKDLFPTDPNTKLAQALIRLWKLPAGKSAAEYRQLVLAPAQASAAPAAAPAPAAPSAAPAPAAPSPVHAPKVLDRLKNWTGFGSAAATAAPAETKKKESPRPVKVETPPPQSEEDEEGEEEEEDDESDSASATESEGSAAPSPRTAPAAAASSAAPLTPRPRTPVIINQPSPVDLRNAELVIELKSQVAVLEGQNASIKADLLRAEKRITAMKPADELRDAEERLAALSLDTTTRIDRLTQDGSDKQARILLLELEVERQKQKSKEKRIQIKALNGKIAALERGITSHVVPTPMTSSDAVHALATHYTQLVALSRSHRNQATRELLHDIAMEQKKTLDRLRAILSHQQPPRSRMLLALAAMAAVVAV